MKRLNAILAILLVSMLPGCAAFTAGDADATIRAQEQALVAYEAETARLKAEVAATTQPTTQPAEIAKREQLAANARAVLEVLKVGSAGATGAATPEQVQQGVTAGASLIPVVRDFAGIIGLIAGGVYGWWQNNRRRRQVGELVTSVEVLGGPTTAAERAALLNAQSDDTITLVKSLKSHAKERAAGLKALAAKE